MVNSHADTRIASVVRLDECVHLIHVQMANRPVYTTTFDSLLRKCHDCSVAVQIVLIGAKQIASSCFSSSAGAMDKASSIVCIREALEMVCRIILLVCLVELGCRSSGCIRKVSRARLVPLHVLIELVFTTH